MDRSVTGVYVVAEIDWGYFDPKVAFEDKARAEATAEKMRCKAKRNGKSYQYKVIPLSFVAGKGKD